jgi:hypothetical protein
MKDNQVTESVSDTSVPDDDLRERLDKLERESQESRKLTDQRLILAELKVEALRAGIVDLDGLKFMDLSEVRLEDNGGVVGGMELINQLKRAKPWLFSGSSSSSVAKAPASGPIRQKLVKDMTGDEYRIARANIIKRPGY